MRLLRALVAAVCAWKSDPAGERLAREAEKAEKKGQVVEAYMAWAKAAAADPGNPTYWTRASALRIPATMVNETRLPPLGTTKQPKPADPNIVGSLTREQLNDIARMTGPPRLRPVPGVRSFDLRDGARPLFEKLGEEYGYTVIFEKDYPMDSQPIRFRVGDIDYRGALHALESATNSFIVPLSERVILVAQDTTQKRQDLEPNTAVGIPIPQRTSVQEAQELMVMVQQALEIRRVALDPVKRLVYMRDRASKIEMAQALFSQLSEGKPQVSVEVEFLSTGRTSSLSLGMSLPTRFPLVNFGEVLKSKPSIPAGFARFLTFGAGKTFLGLGVTDAALFATASRSEASSLLRSTITASDGQAATLHIGDKYPIQTGAYGGYGGGYGGSGLDGLGGITYAAISTAAYADLIDTRVSNTGKMKLVVNSQEIPLDLPDAANNLASLQNILNSSGAGIGAQVIERGTNDQPYTLLVVASTLGITSIQLYDDPTGANIALLKPPDRASSISRVWYADTTDAAVSDSLSLDLAAGETVIPLLLSDATNNLEGLRDAINSANAGVTASILYSGLSPRPYYMQIVATAANTGAIQVYDDPTGARTALFAPTDEVDAFGSSFGNQVPGSSSSGLGLGQNYGLPPTFNFEDLGLVLKITPTIHSLEEVTLDVEAEFKVLGSGSFNDVPVISVRKYQGKVRLRTSEYAVVAGLMSESDTRTMQGLAGLSSLPVLGQVFRENTRSKDSSQVLLVIKPSVTSMPPSEARTRLFWYGSEMKPLTVL